ncbi:7TM GPCR serpentine receptor class x (Srx) domain-containing protein [Caenorhabditis elegans]|uniref:7TM GPCR serpentine receptor class x (Srx) domain-containing protein n=1 Tax=Caenorhabditis elegans TaxID=6239 RepID=O17093_CAEEL|nr:7TM GPCR serpentine receptor class x (Srx) domain-containing protein [Caenorhabditis elegans]CCD67495.1 7TM GPCR serpentine receptor class x (Srx) domain-containing protein [Caenorhabditis elegans]|eukprot:NP_494619.2 Serpentine Receptor, class X [Caenorhabditis elegans]
MDINEFSTRIVGVYMLLTSFCGILINLYMLYYFSKLQKTSFYILCASKTISNIFMLLTYFFYVGPVNVLYTPIGPSALNTYVNQMNSFGFYLQGPVTQLMITVNRFLVVWISAAKASKDSKNVTVVVLTISWVFAIWYSTLLGFPDDCRMQVNFGHVPWTRPPCALEMIYVLIIIIFSLGVFTNILNILIAIKLFILSKYSKLLSSVSFQNRRKSRIYLFLQSCFQDWIVVVDILNNFGSNVYCANRTCIVLVTMGFGVMVYAADGIVMYLFNCKLNSDVNKNSRKLNRDVISPNRRLSTIVPIS